jgi:cytochrome c2
VRGEGNQIGPELTRVGVRLKPDYMFQFVKDPLGIIPGTAMRDFELWDSEASSLALYLETLR